MLRNQAAYSRTAFDQQKKPVFHWSELLTGDAYLPGMDIDFVSSSYFGRRVIIESKPLGAKISKAQSAMLEELAADSRNVVILVGTAQIEPDLFTDGAGVAACWVEVDRAGRWRKPEAVTHGTPESFKAFFADLLRSIRLRCAPANEATYAVTA